MKKQKEIIENNKLCHNCGKPNTNKDLLCDNCFKIENQEHETNALESLKEIIADYNQNPNDIIVYEKYILLGETARNLNDNAIWIFKDILSKYPYKKENFILVDHVSENDLYAVTIDDDNLDISLYKNVSEIFGDNDLWYDEVFY